MVSISLIIGVDPGLMTGVTEVAVPAMTFSSHELTALAACDLVEGWAARYGADLVVSCERYTIMGRGKTSQPDALEVIGALRWICHRHGSTFELRGAADAARIGNPALIRAVRWHTPGPGHADRATAQVIATLAERLPGQFMRLTGVGRIDT